MPCRCLEVCFAGRLRSGARYPLPVPPLATPQPYGPLAGGTLTDKYFSGGEPGANARHVKASSRPGALALQLHGE